MTPTCSVLLTLLALCTLLPISAVAARLSWWPRDAWDGAVGLAECGTCELPSSQADQHRPHGLHLLEHRRMSRGLPWAVGGVGKAPCCSGGRCQICSPDGLGGSSPFGHGRPGQCLPTPKLLIYKCPEPELQPHEYLGTGQPVPAVWCPAWPCCCHGHVLQVPDVLSPRCSLRGEILQPLGPQL